MFKMGRLTTCLKVDLGLMKGKTDQEIVNSLNWGELTLSEIWDRLLRRNRLVQRLFPKTAFLTALDTPRLQPRFPTTSKGPK